MDNVIELWTTCDDGETISISDDFQGTWFWNDLRDAKDSRDSEPNRKLYRVLVKVVAVEVCDD